MSKSVLIVSYFFPPVGGAGVQRVAKFVKYLPELNWEPVVLTVENPSVPLFDESLLADIPSTVAVHKARTFEPSYGAKQAVSASTESGNSGFSIKSQLKGLLRRVASMLLQPDPQVLWLPAAYRKACKVLRERPVNVIFASAPPFSSLVLGAKLARKFNIPLVLDYRDEWDISNSVWENKRLGRVSLAVQRWMQNYAIKSASSIVATTDLSAETLREKARKLGSNAKVVCIYNGYDAADFPDTKEGIQRSNDRYELTYVGTLWNLTSVAPLVEAINSLSARKPELAKKLRLVIAGRRTAEQEEILGKVDRSSVELKIHGYLQHGESVALVRKSQGLLLLLSDMELAKRVVPGKIFEYFATNNSILAIAPEGEVWKLMEGYPNSLCVEPVQSEAIAEFLIEVLQKFPQPPERGKAKFDAKRYERRELTAALTDVLTQVAK